MHDKTYNKTCATSGDSDQTAHPRSLIGIFVDRMCLVQPPGYPKRDERELLPYGFTGHTGLIVGFVVRWLICKPQSGWPCFLQQLSDVVLMSI